MKNFYPFFALLMSLCGTVSAQENLFLSEGSSRQINLPDNQGTININQYLVKSDDYHALVDQSNQMGVAIEEKKADCAAFEAANNAERLAKCRLGLAAMVAQNDSITQLITQFKGDVMRLAESFQRIPLNSERLRKAKALFDEGKFREANAVMNAEEMTTEGEALLLEKARLNRNTAINDSLLKVKAEEFYIKAQAKAVDYADPRRIDSTAFCYRQSLRYTDEPQTLYDFAQFFSENHLYDSAFAYFPKIMAHPKAADWQIANASDFLGDLYTQTGNLPAALAAYTKFFEAYKKLSQSYLDNSSIKNNLAISYERLGSTHRSLGNLEAALSYFEQSKALEKKLHESYPQNVNFKNGLAISYEKLGSTHRSLGNLEAALKYFEDETQLFKELHENYPQNVGFKNGLAVSYQYLGITQSALGNLVTALSYFVKFNTLEKELYESYPQNVEYKNNLAISYERLGETHRSLGNLEAALSYFEQYKALT